MSLTNESIYSIIVDTADRISGTPDNFLVRFVPSISRVREMSLQSVFLPFNFNNVTQLYGNILQWQLVYGPGTTIAGQITLPIGFYNETQLITAINAEFQEVFNLPPISSTTPISFTLSSIPHRVLLTYDATNFPIPATLTFTIPPLNASTQVVPNFLYKMLGLNSNSPTVFTFNTIGQTSYTAVLPNPVDTQLPISYILMRVEGLPTKVITSHSIGGQFYIDISAANLDGKLIALPNSYKAYSDYFNTIILPNNFFSFQELNVQIVDNFGRTLIEQNVVDWHFSFKVSSY